jgi:hypothetical protein
MKMLASEREFRSWAGINDPTLEAVLREIGRGRAI